MVDQVSNNASAPNGKEAQRLPDVSQNNSKQEEPRSTQTTHQPNGAQTNGAELNPTRIPVNYSNLPSPSATQRSLLPQRAQTASLDGLLEGAKDKNMKTRSMSPSWPTPPRLKSPPPSARGTNTRRAEHDQTQSNTTRRLANVSTLDSDATIVGVDGIKEQSNANQSQVRAPGRGVSAQTSGLETVAEGSVPTTPSPGPISNPMESSNADISIVEQSKDVVSPEASGDGKTQDGMNKGNSNKAENDQQSRASSTSRPAEGLAKRSLTSLTGAKKPTVEPMRTMTVETELVNSMPQLLGDRNREGGSVRTKPSSEAIRPKKEKKKTSRKPASLHAGGGTTKADIFEAKVASAVDEADTSDSDETFVYESNPPEQRTIRHHSRTPSATSLASAVDPFGARNKHGLRSNSNAVSGKKSTKFSNSGYRDPESEGHDSIRNGSRASSSTPRHHHIGRYGRNGHPSILDKDSPFTQASKAHSPRISTGNLARVSQHNSRTNSPKGNNDKLLGSPRKYGGAAYDNFEDAADDERAPLMGSVRVNRTRHNRRPHSREFRSLDYPEDRETGCWSRFGGCIVLVFLVLLICIGVATFVVALNRALVGVEIKRITNVLASEQELMLDLEVRAVNPNLFAITVNDLDINIFAESPYVGTAEEWQRTHPSKRLSPAIRRKQALQDRSWFPFPPFHPDDGVDEGTDPDDEPEPGNQKMLLGRITEFDAPLQFDATPIRRIPTSSSGAIRLAKPGNRTEVGGSERWERVLQHPFDLIIRGVIKYQLPLSSKTRSAKVSGRRQILPEDDGGGGGGDSGGGDKSSQSDDPDSAWQS